MKMQMASAVGGACGMVAVCVETFATNEVPFPEKDRTVAVFVLTGQSNSLGTTSDPKENDITPGTDLLDAKIPFFWSNVGARDGRSALILDSGGKIATLRAQQGQGANKLFWGPEIGFGRGLAAARPDNFLIVKASNAGGGNGLWLKGSADDYMYRHVVMTVRQAVDALPAKMKFQVAALLYVQGESDTGDEAATAGERLRRLAANLRKDLPQATRMKVLVGGIAAPGADRDTVRAQQAALPTVDPSFRYINTLDLRPKLYDGLHFNKAAKLEIGRRMCEVWLEWNKVVGTPSPESAGEQPTHAGSVLKGAGI